MALVFPVVHDFAGAGTSQWETLSSTAITGSDAEVNPLADENNSLEQQSYLPRTPIRHNGKLTLQYHQVIESNFEYFDGFTRVVRQLNNGTWETLGAAEDLGYSATNFSQPRGIFSYDGNLFCAVEVGRKDRTKTGTFSSNQDFDRVRIYQYNETLNTWEEETDASVGLSNQTLNIGGNTGRFFVLNGKLFYFWAEQIWVTSQRLQTNTQIAFAERNNGTWSRVATGPKLSMSQHLNLLFAEDELTFVVDGNHLYYMVKEDIIFRFTDGSGITQWSTASTGLSGTSGQAQNAEWGDGVPVKSSTNIVTKRNGGPVVTFREGKSTSPYYVADKYSISTINGTANSYTRTEFNNPASDLLFYSMIEENGEEYYLFQSNASGNEGLVLYRKNGSSWSIVGGGLAVPGLVNYFTKLRIFGGSVYIFTRAYQTSSNNYVIRRFPL